ncbi:MAG: hydantoinase/oxoprolinase family protein, partial [Dehalococcoidia bacterium]|nr:hydantoinase/oxoprolinase family protein [Dehalococcoidia bacterium]
EDKVRSAGFSRPLLIVHASGGVARVAKTHALQTYSSGPAAGLAGASKLAALYGLPRVLTADMGGTSLDVGLVVDGKYSASLRPQVNGIPLAIPMIGVESLGAGGGSIARVDHSGRLTVGPESAGAMPGPACYDRSGTEATITDADVVLRYIDPDYFLGGRYRLNKERATTAVKEKVAKPLGISVEEAALRMKKQMDEEVGRRLSHMLAQKGFDGRDFTMFAYGGAGPVHCCGYAEQAGISKIMSFPFASVFSAYGASTMDVAHTYIKTKPVRLFDAATGSHLSELDAFNCVVRGLQDRALVDMRGEGFKPEEVRFDLDLIIVGDGSDKQWISSPRVSMENVGDVELVCEECWTKSGGQKNRDVLIQSFMLKATAGTTHWDAPLHDAQGQDPRGALAGERDVYWENGSGFTRTNVYRRELLRPGNVVQGPAVVEALDTAMVVPSG